MPLTTNDRITLSIAGASIAIGLSIQILNHGHPAVLVACCFSMAVASIIYRYLGGVSSSSVRIRAIKLGGSAAVFAILAYFINGQLVSQGVVYQSNKDILDKLNSAAFALENEQKTVASLRDQLNKGGIGNPRTISEQLRDGSVSTSDVREIKRMVEQSEKPFKNTLREMTTKITVVGDIRGSKFRYCPDVMDRLYDGLNRQSDVQFFGESNNILLKAIGPIDLGKPSGSGICSNPNREFDIQIGCTSAEDLFGDVAKDCRSSGALKGKEVVLGAVP
jgi:hypothetical protein